MVGTYVIDGPRSNSLKEHLMQQILVTDDSLEKKIFHKINGLGIMLIQYTLLSR